MVSNMAAIQIIINFEKSNCHKINAIKCGLNLGFAAISIYFVYLVSILFRLIFFRGCKYFDVLVQGAY